ncbi:YceD family protein [Candidatus Vesicomyidisocius sp. SY067_SCS001]|uniref:YceD family protein n=1 Tax=Candidatus Vesicomyidisocius sp. SY067_SCS001 TaxID=2732590 RepID=UPI001687D77F|nr:YceD family protein [Candidatus Vesicomyosocius sp. SY067_SCS001]
MQGIPDIIKLFSFAKKGLNFSHIYKVKDFPRMKKLLSNIDDKIKVELSFYIKNNVVPCIKGSIQLNAVVDCQRCLNKVNIHLSPSFKIGFLKNEQQKENLDSSFETILNTDKTFSTIEFITDELLISIPMSPMHSYDCQSYQDKEWINSQDKYHPFARLKQLKD